MAGKIDIFYDGQHVYWYGAGNFKGTFKATSGLTGHQSASEQTKSDMGPIPAGRYTFSIKLAGTAHVVDVAHSTLDTKQGIESLDDMPGPDGKLYQSSAWGHNRVRLNPQIIFNSKARHRGGFYLHDSTKGYSHGCIEVQPTFFTKLRSYAEQQAKERNGRRVLTLLVQYPNAKASTYGKTDK